MEKIKEDDDDDDEIDRVIDVKTFK